MAEGDHNGTSLSALFDQIWDIYQFVDNCDDPIASDNVQLKVRNGIQKAEAAIKMVNELDLFSQNEDFEEVSSNEIKYMLLPALIGYLTNQNTHAERVNVVTKVETFYTDYLKLVENYHVVDVKIPEPSQSNSELVPSGPPSGAMDMLRMAGNRQAKIEQFKKKKEMERRLCELQTQVEKEHVDEDVKREYYTTLLKKWVDIALEEIDAVSFEIPILQHREKLKQESKSKSLGNPAPAKEKKQSFRPFILTKTMLQKQVFGLGYPSIPTLTLDEFYERRVQDGTFASPQSGQGAMSVQDRTNNPEQAAQEDEDRDAEKERKIEDDDEEELGKARGMDEYKDDHRRGWGNRKNRL